jgi:ubiquinone/menaquinone biosynthesis C-methylase UbiE
MKGVAADWWTSYFDADYLTEHEPMFGAGRDRPEVSRVLDLLGAPVGARVLDCPCGQGRHATLLAENGLKVTGVDYSSHLLKKAAQAAKGVAGVDFVEGDMRKLPARWRNRFDAVVSLGASFGFFATRAEDELALANYARVLKPGGSFILHAANRDGIMASFIEKDWWESPTGDLILHERTFDPLSGLLDVHVQLRRGARTRRRSYRLRLYSPSELAAIAARNGIIVTAVYDGYADRDVRRRSGEMLLVGHRDV